MSIGDQDDIVARIVGEPPYEGVLPRDWFKASAVFDGAIAGFASIGSWAYGLLAYARLQMRIQTSTDGWLDMASSDYLGDGVLPRLGGEPDDIYAQRILDNILPQADTRAAISRAIEVASGEVPRLVEPWNPSDTGVIDGMYMDIDTAETPGRITDPSMRYQGFVDSIIPGIAALGGNPVPCMDDGLFCDAPGSSMFDLPVVSPKQLVYDAANRVKVEGTVLWVRFVSHSVLARGHFDFRNPSWSTNYFLLGGWPG